MNLKFIAVRRLKILQIFSRYQNPGGEEFSVYRIGDALQKNHDVEYFLGSSDDLLRPGFTKNISAPFLSWHNPRSSHLLRRYQAVGHFDFWLIHNVLPGLSPSVYETAFSLGVPVIHYLHNYRMGCVNGFFLNHGLPCEKCLSGNFWPALRTACWHESHVISGLAAAYTLRIRSLGTFQKAAGWIALSQSQREKHIQMGLPANRIHVVPHFCDPLEDSPPPCPHGDVLFLGRLSPEKGVDHLLRAWKLLTPSGRRLKIAGDGPEMPKLLSLSKRLGLANVDFLGFVDKVQQRSLWSRVAFSVIPSVWSEPFGLAFLEAWTSGRTFVSYRIGAMAEMVEDGLNGLLANPFSVTSLADQIQRLLASPDLCVAMGQAGRAKVYQGFQKDQWLDRIEHVFFLSLNHPVRSLP